MRSSWVLTSRPHAGARAPLQRADAAALMLQRQWRSHVSRVAVRHARVGADARVLVLQCAWRAFVAREARRDKCIIARIAQHDAELARRAKRARVTERRAHSRFEWANEAVAAAHLLKCTSYLITST